MSQNSSNTSKTVLKALELFEVLSQTGGGATNAELASRMDISPSTCHRLLNTLESKGYVAREEKKYHLGYKVFQLKGLTRKQERVKRIVRPFMEELEIKCGNTVGLGMRRGLNVIPIEIVRGSQYLMVNNNLGKPIPLHATSLGKSLLAFCPEEVRRLILSQITLSRRTDKTIISKGKLIAELDKVRERGYAVDNEEFTEGVVCVGVPVLEVTDYPKYAVSVLSPAARMNDDKIDKIAGGLKDVRERVARRFT